MKQSVFASLLLAVCATGCSHPVDEFIDKTVELLETRCACPALAGSTTEAECLDAIRMNVDSPMYVQATECLKGVYDRNTNALEGTVECERQALDSATSCHNSAGCNEVAFERCDEEFIAASQRCPQPPPAVDEEADACVP